MKKISIIILLATFAYAGCGKKAEEASAFPEYKVLTGNCPDLSGTCETVFKEELDKGKARSIQFDGVLNQPGSRIAFILNSSTPELKDGIQVYFTRTATGAVESGVRVNNADYVASASTTHLWVASNLSHVFDFHPQGTSAAKIFVWRKALTTYEANSADWSTIRGDLPAGYLTTNSGTGIYSGLILTDASIVKDSLTISADPKLVTP